MKFCPWNSAIYTLCFSFKSKLLNNNVRDYTDVETPCSISNQEAKHIVGDDTTPYWQGESSSLRTLFFLFLKIQFDYAKRGLSLMFAYFIFRTKKDAVVLGLALEWLSYATSLENIE